MQQELAGRVALVTGAAVGIGQAVALELGAAGAVIGLHYHLSEQEARATQASLETMGVTCLLLQADLTSEEQANAVVDRLLRETGRLDILVNNAGSPLRRARIEECPTDLWREVFDVNVHSAFFVTRQAIPHLRASGHGSIINNLTLSVQTGGANGAGPYAAAKGALQVMTRTLARELAPQVRVNAIMPGVIERATTRFSARPSAWKNIASKHRSGAMAAPMRWPRPCAFWRAMQVTLSPVPCLTLAADDFCVDDHGLTAAWGPDEG
jgi:3-oxoacyl-[acyl-carrier protein] reductase